MGNSGNTRSTGKAGNGTEASDHDAGADPRPRSADGADGPALEACRGRILGIDPGLACAGWGVIDTTHPELRLVAHGAIRTGRSLPHAERLRTIFDGVRAVIASHAPYEMAVEEVFQGKSARSALLLGEGRGACIVAGASAGLRVLEYPASVVKLALTGNGRAAKAQIQAMVRRLLGLGEVPRPHDAADALAVAITHFQRSRPRGFEAGLRGLDRRDVRGYPVAPPRSR